MPSSCVTPRSQTFPHRAHRSSRNNRAECAQSAGVLAAIFRSCPSRHRPRTRCCRHLALISNVLGGCFRMTSSLSQKTNARVTPTLQTLGARVIYSCWVRFRTSQPYHVSAFIFARSRSQLTPCKFGGKIGDINPLALCVPSYTIEHAISDLGGP